MLLLDYDGTLLREDGLDACALRELESLGRAGVVRVLATGRSPFSLLRSLQGRRLPLDYLILSTGVGIVSAGDWRTIRSLAFGAQRLREAVSLLRGLDLDFAVHSPFPENHRFVFRRSSSAEADLDRRLALYRGFHRELEDHEVPGEASQVVAISGAASGAESLRGLHRGLDDGTTIVRTTSPLDGHSVWVELFPRGAGKGAAAEWLSVLLGCDPSASLAVGNDYNDLDMLDWAGEAAVMGDSPPDLLGRYPRFASAFEALVDWSGSW
jgi:hypothetical protein